MKKSKKVQVWRAAELVYENLRIRSDCFDYSGQVIKSRVIVCIDDDPWSAVWASWLFHKMLGQGSAPVVLCVGGQGLLSRHTDNKELKAELEKMLGQKNRDIYGSQTPAVCLSQSRCFSAKPLCVGQRNQHRRQYRRNCRISG